MSQNSSYENTRIKVYTAITGEKDELRTDIKCFTEYPEFKRPVLNAKIYKILSHQFLDTDISIWVDGNIKLLIPEKRLVKEWLGDADMAVWKHFDRDDVYEEGMAAIGLGGEQVPYIEKHLEYYEEIDFPHHTGLAECNVLIRRHNQAIKNFNNAWWGEICRHSNRDQLSFPKVLLEYPIKVNFIEGNARDHNWFEYTPH